MDFLRDLLKIEEGFDPDFHNMSDAELMDLCVELEMEDACELDDDGKIVNREALIRDLEAGHGPVGGAYRDASDVDVPMEPRTEGAIPVIKHRGKKMSNTRKHMNYFKPVKVKESAPVVKFAQKANGNKKPALPAYGGKQGDVNNKPVNKAIEDEIGDAGMKGMFKKDRPFPEKKRPTFKDWLTGNMIFDMTPSGPRAGDKMEGEKKDGDQLNELKLPSKFKRFVYGTAYETQPEKVIKTVKGMDDREVSSLHHGYEKEGDVAGRKRGSPADVQKRALRREYAKRKLALPEIDPKFKA